MIQLSLKNREYTKKGNKEKLNWFFLNYNEVKKSMKKNRGTKLCLHYSIMCTVTKDRTVVMDSCIK